MKSLPKKKNCKACRASYSPARPLQSCCSPLCALEIARQVREKKARQEALADRRVTKEKLSALEPLAKLEKRAETQVNAYVRARDHYKRLGCVSCDKPWDWVGRWNASHFRSVGAASGLRYHLWNIQSACWVCNQIFSGRIADYEPVLVQRIGQERVDWLKAQNKPVRYSREYLERLRAIFAKKTRRMLARIKEIP